jgi:hypothetical protein
MKKIGIGVLVLIIVGIIVYSLSTVKHTSNPVSNTITPSTNTPQPSSASTLENPIKNTATTPGFTVSSAMVENNVDSITQKPVNDHLEFTLKNTSGKDLTNFEVYYTIIDTVTFKKETYYVKLIGLTLKNNEAKTVHFDNGSGDGHFPSQNSDLYKNSPNKLLFNILVSAPGYKVESTDTSKATGTGEKSD